MAPDLPGVGPSDPISLSRHRYRETTVDWLDHLLDTLDVGPTTLLGHSVGGLWALWYALAHPGRVRRLVLVAPPALPKTRAPLPIRLRATPGVGELLSRLFPPSPRSVLRLARFMGEETALAGHPNLVDLLVAVGRDPVADRVAKAGFRTVVSPFALVSPSGLRRRSRVPGRAASGSRAHPGDLGRTGPARGRVGRPGSSGPDPAGAIGRAPSWARTMARTGSANRGGDSGLRPVNDV